MCFYGLKCPFMVFSIISVSFPGLWEIPLVMWNDLGSGRCSMLDACSNPSNAEDVYKLLWQNFARHYNTNRAPIGLFYHAQWFTQPHNMEGFERFLDTILSLDDVWFVTSWQAIQWMRNLANPVDPLNFEPFQCNYKKVPFSLNIFDNIFLTSFQEIIDVDSY